MHGRRMHEGPGRSAGPLVRAAERQRAFELLFGTGEGARFVHGRIPIGASDYAMDRYTLSERPDDFTMASFSIARDEQRLVVGHVHALR